MIIDMNTLSPAQAYMTMIQTIIPRPVAWVLSENQEANFNLAPFSYFNAVCSDPPLIMLSIARQNDGSDKDTRTNIEARKEFVVHIAHREMANAMTQSSATLPSGVSEVEKLGLELTEFDGFRLPRLAACRVAFACTLEKSEEIGNSAQCLLFGRIQYTYTDNDVITLDAKNRRKILAEKIDPIGRLGGGEYSTFGEKIFIQRPD